MKNLTSTFALLSLITLFVFSSCTDSVTNSDVVQASEEDITVLEHVIGDALSDKGEGFLSTIQDLTAQLSQEGMQYRFRQNQVWRGPFNNYNYQYNPENGVHLIQYRRGFTRPNLSQLLQVQLEYVFVDASNGFIEFPGQDADMIETIAFSGTRSGFTDAPVRRSEFERSANWTVEGFSAANEFMSLNGVQTNSGSMIVRGREDILASRTFNTTFNLLNITIQKPDATEDRLEYLITGEIEYEVIMVMFRNGEEITREFSGTIQLEGDGSALVRILGLNRVIRLNLGSGEAF